MKYNRKNILFTIIILCFAGLININAHSNSNHHSTTCFYTITDSVEWVFTPSQVNPQYGSSRQITPADYTLNFSAGKITAYLPYYGRAYGGADIFADRSPLYFTSTDFNVTTTDGKKGSKELTIRFKDQREISNMYFTIFPNGNANLSVNMTNRSAISFIGKVDVVK